MTGFLHRLLTGAGDRLHGFFDWTGFADKKLIDYIQLIVLPFVLIAGGQLVSQAVNASARAQALEDAQEQRLQEYLDQMASLALDRDLLSAEVAPERLAVIREVARAQTLTALAGMDGPRKRFVVTFLYELGLINGVDPPILLATADLVDADLVGAELFASNISGANLSGADLSRARLTFALLNSANLSAATLTGALLVDVRLNQSDLRLANLDDTDLSNASMFNADLRRADLRGANLRGANLRSADLRGADLTGADLTGANLADAVIGEDDSQPGSRTALDDVTWSLTVCPDQTTSTTGPDASCDDHLTPREVQ
ncbi:MAG: pentapeptide repeat-containing protein [Dehalococcoidia bacterium]